MAETEYLVFSRERGGERWISLTPAGAVKARSATEAIRATVDSEGDYVAVPARSWNPVTVQVKTEQRVTVKPAVAPRRKA